LSLYNEKLLKLDPQDLFWLPSLDVNWQKKSGSGGLLAELGKIN
jgi:hypothetical protein